jgi:hypothetical protein
LDAAAREAILYGDDDEDDYYCDDPDVRDGETSLVRRIGVVPHRLGSPSINDIDRRWMRALGLVSVALGIDSMGVLTRTRGGDLVSVPESAAA